MISSSDNRRLLVIDDNPAIFDDIRKVLLSPNLQKDFEATRNELFGDSAPTPPAVDFHIEYSDQGQQGFEMVQDAVQNGTPYAMAFVDMRMPPGWDGAETIEHIWQVDADIQIVICTAYSDHDWEHLLKRLTQHDKLLILRKPFDPIEIRQLAVSLTERWNQQVRTKQQLDDIAAFQEERAWEIQETIRELEHEANRPNNSANPS
jgi:CheY-like chemotaxis protein